MYMIENTVRNNYVELSQVQVETLEEAVEVYNQFKSNGSDPCLMTWREDEKCWDCSCYILRVI